MYNEYRAAQRAAVERWALRQEATLEREIERQLHRNFTNYEAAQRAFFEDWTRTSMFNTYNSATAPYRTTVDKLKEEQTSNKTDLYNLRTWKEGGLMNSCGIIESEACNRFKNRKVNGWSLKNIVRQHQYDYYYSEAVNDFGGTKYKIDDAKAELKGLSTQLGPGKYLDLNKLIQTHIDFVNRKGPIDRVLYMASYLVARNNGIYAQGHRVFSNLNLPTHFSKSELIRRGRANKPSLTVYSQLFGPGIVQKSETSVCKSRTVVSGPRGVNIRTVCDALSSSQKAIRQQILDLAYLEGELFDRNLLCGTYNWTTVGNSWTVNIDDLGLSYGFYVPYRGKLVIENAEFGRSCVTIPKKIRNVIGNLESVTKTRANTLFNLAWKSAIIITESELEGNSKNIIDLKRIMRKNLQSTIKSWGGSMATFTVGPCRSGVAVSKARYCF
ncbi:hypothetical protein FGF1_33080 [Flavobacteriaceae bacterium GF1]